MLRVPFYKNANFAQELIGWVILRGDKLEVYPSSAPLKAILKSPVLGKEGLLFSDESPKDWLKALPKMYHGSYLWAGKPEES